MKKYNTSARLIAGLSAAAVLLGGCSYYDYFQRTDRVGHSAGDAVKANLEGQTSNPSGDSRYTTKGLGKDGNVTDPSATDDE